MKIIQYYRVLQVLVRNSIPVQFQYNFKIEHPRLRAQKQWVKFRIFRPIKQRKSSEFFRIQNFFFTDRMLRGGDKRERSAELLRDAAKAAFGGGKLNKNIQEGQRFGEQNKKDRSKSCLFPLVIGCMTEVRATPSNTLKTLHFYGMTHGFLNKIKEKLP